MKNYFGLVEYDTFWERVLGKKKKLADYPRIDRKEIEKRESGKRPYDFRVGEVYQMSPTNCSHVTKPYYVTIKTVTESFIETSIPYRQSLVIKYEDKFTWNYHIARMTYIGNDKQSERLLYNQKLI